jgi:spermidine/putrescine-binding protein
VIVEEQVMSKANLFHPLALLVIASLVLSSCGSGAKEIPTATIVSVTSTGFDCPEPEFPIEVTSTELNLFVRTEYVPSDVQKCFEQVYGVKVNRDEYSNDEDMYAGILGGGSNYDLVLPSDYSVVKMVRQNLLQEIEHVRLPVLRNFDPNYLDFEFDPGNKYTIPYLVGTDAIVVNTGTLENIPQSWADLWEPEYAGRMVFLDDSRAVIGITLLTLGYDINTTDPVQLKEAREKLLELVPNIKLFDNDSSQRALLVGAVDLGMTRTGQAFLAQQANPSIQYVFPTEGVIFWQDNWAMLKNAPHSDAAYAWLNYINQGNVFWMVLRDFPYTIPNTAALDYAKNHQKDIYNAYIGSPITNPSVEVIKMGHRITDVGDALTLYEQIWNEVTVH